MKKFLLSFFAVLFAFAGVQAQTWTKVTDASTLKAGDQLVIACSGKGVVASSLSSNYLDRVAATFSSDKSTITALPSSAAVLTLGGSKDAWILANASGQQLGATAVKKVAWNNGKKTWSISITNGSATIQSTTSSYGRFLYNSSSPRFTTYTSNTNASMILPELYRLETSTGGETPDVPEVQAPVAPTLPEATSFTDEEFVVEITNNADNAIVYYSLNNENDWVEGSTVTIYETTTVYAKAVDADDETNESQVVSATYTKIEPKTIAEVIADGAVDQAMTSGTVVATYSRGFLLGDGTGYILVFQGASLTTEFSAGDVVAVSGPTYKYNGFLQFQTTAVIEKTGTADVVYPNVTTLDGEAMDAYLTAPSIQYVEYTGKLTIDGSYYNIAVDGASTAIGSIQYPKENVVEAENNDVVKVTGYTIGVSNSSGSPKYVNTMAVSVEVVEGDDTDPEEPTEPVVPENPVSGTEVTGNATVNYGTSTIEIEKFEVAPVTLTFAKNSGSTAPAYNKAGDCRIYAKGSITATCSAGNLTKIVFTISAQGKKRITDLTPSTGTVTIADDHSTVTWEGNAAEVVLTVGDVSFGTENGKAGQICFTEFTATYVIPSYTLTVTDAGYATLFLDFNAAIPAEVEAYTVTKVNDGYVTLTPVTGVLPANTGVIVKAAKGEYNFVSSTDEATNIDGNLLEGTTTAEEKDFEAYVLGIVDGNVGLYKAKMAGGVWLNNANKAYLPASAVPNKTVAFYGFDWDGTTGVEKVEIRNEKEEIYDLTGRRVEAITAPGIYIVNGKKVLVK